MLSIGLSRQSSHIYNNINRLVLPNKVINHVRIIDRAFSSSNNSVVGNNVNKQNTRYNVTKQWFDIDAHSTYHQLRYHVNKILEPLTTSISNNNNNSNEITNNNNTSGYQPLFTGVTVPKIKADYSISNTFQLSRQLGGDNKKIVEQMRQLIQKDIDENRDGMSLIKDVSVEKNFVNVSLSQDYLEQSLAVWLKGEAPLYELTKQHKQSLQLPLEPKEVLVDFASPNMSKELHVGHLRSLALGESVCRILEYRNHRVERVSHAGDFGTPMGMVISYALENKAEFLRHIWDKQSGLSSMPFIPTPKQLSTIYSDAKKLTKTDSEFSKRAHLAAAELQKGPPTTTSGDNNNGGSDPDIYRAWLDLMDINVKERGESWYREMLEPAIEELRSLNMVSESEGAVCVFLEDQKTPVIIKKSDGAYLYATTDIAAIKNRLVTNKKQWVIIITDDSQKQHFQQVFTIAQLAGWYRPDTEHRVDHLSFGVVRGENGLKLSSREGDPLALEELLQEAIQRAKDATITSRSLTRAEKLDQTHTAQQLDGADRVEDRFELDQYNTWEHYRKIGLGAIKYFDLSQRSNSYTFSFDRMLSFKGNTSIYILYCYTRISTLMKRAQFDINAIDLNTFKFKEFSEKERKLVLMISKFPDVIRATESTLRPAVLCDYLWDISDCFHHFYESERVIGSDTMVQKLLIAHVIQNIINTGFHLLGLETVDRL
ncbi:arginyl-tRNA synthetase [Heterostelium album PN500]|uniref:arginine--tRNA ligase n=1 Tax=Heterostelium pallidum (strain ATCC 26659 / Pp 5 / PN500) TaxID=670386 RepID=D3B8P9_HETP5|nr:arginyl-tRNA synthetase [Heterostelium album PN500]EFA82417.1 arginyl-tRNA synthetase [Heterostelium album PN500]|eukprot:XP_020434534.1 arginyl-tRNA synthetase [Heterostelium album PN500]